MKDVEDPRLRQLKIKAIVNQFFSKGAATGVGFDGQVLREISSTPPDKVTVSMLISGGFSNWLSVSSNSYWLGPFSNQHQFESLSQRKLVSWSLLKIFGAKLISQPSQKLKNKIFKATEILEVKWFSTLVINLVKWQIYGEYSMRS